MQKKKVLIEIPESDHEFMKDYARKNGYLLNYIYGKIIADFIRNNYESVE